MENHIIYKFSSDPRKYLGVVISMSLKKKLKTFHLRNIDGTEYAKVFRGFVEYHRKGVLV